MTPGLTEIRALLDEAEDLAVLAAARRRLAGDRLQPTPPDRAAHAVRATRAALRVPEPGCTSGLGMHRGASDFVFLEEEQPLVDKLQEIDDTWARFCRAVDAGEVHEPGERARTVAALALSARVDAAPELAVRLKSRISDDPIGPAALLRDFACDIASGSEPDGAGTRFPGLHAAFGTYVAGTVVVLQPSRSAHARLELLAARAERPRLDGVLTCEGRRLVEVLDAALSASTTYGSELTLEPCEPSRTPGGER